MNPAAPKPGPSAQPRAAPIRAGLSTEALKQAVVDNLMYRQARYPAIATLQNWYIALAHSVRDRMLERWVTTVMAYAARDVKVACYFSAEFLIGPQLGNNLMCLGIEDAARAAIAELGQDLDALVAYENEPGLGSGGLGRLAACYLDSLATLSLPAIGYGIRYEFGIFDQEIRDGWQVEVTDKWLAHGNPWEIERPEVGCVRELRRPTERTPTRTAARCALDPGEPGQGHRVRHPRAQATNRHLQHVAAVEQRGGGVVRLPRLQRRRLLRRRARESDLGDALQGALPERRGGRGQAAAPRATVLLRLVLAPGHASAARHEGRAVAAAARPVRGAVERHAPGARGRGADAPARRRACASSGTRPGRSRSARLAYTNHTLLPEALETWGAAAVREACCRVRSRSSTRSTAAFSRRCAPPYPGDDARVTRLSLIDEAGEKRRAHGAISPPSAATRSMASRRCTRDLLKQTVLRDFAELWPERFCNVTNGVTPRRFLALGNPGLASLLDEVVGEGWITDLARLRAIERTRTTRRFASVGARSKRLNKERLAALHPRAHRHRRRSNGAVRHPSQAHTRVQAAALERAARHRSTGGSCKTRSARSCRVASSSPARLPLATRWPS